MATFTDGETVRRMVARDGSYEDDPPPISIWEARRLGEFKPTWVVCYTDADSQALIEAVTTGGLSVVLLWSRVGGPTEMGYAFSGRRAERAMYRYVSERRAERTSSYEEAFAIGESDEWRGRLELRRPGEGWREVRDDDPETTMKGGF